MKWENIIVHCSASTWGSASEIRKWHLQRQFDDIGYHFVIGNGRPRPNFLIPELIGNIEIGRKLDGDSVVSEDEEGAHALGFNDKAIGICLIGDKAFHPLQIQSLGMLVNSLRVRFNIPISEVLGHYEVNSGKTCPNFHMEAFRHSLDPSCLFALPRWSE